MYDYVIVGAGSAGCVLAGRLSENPSIRVLLLEAGPPDDAVEIHIPAAINLLFKSRYDWDYNTLPQERACGRSIYWPRGKTLGGSSSINAMVYIRGNRYDYDTWRDEYGCLGWGYADLLPYFVRAEANSRSASPYHGRSGPLSVRDLASRSRLTRAFVSAAQAAGADANDDFNGPHQDGVGFYQVTQRDGRRCSAADAYLHPAASRPNLTVLTDALVTSVEVEGGRALGVHYLRRGAEEFATAEAEVILSAGTVGSPHLLMLSGVGPADHLHEHGIAVLADSPGVGANLCDHPMVAAIWAAPRARAAWELVERRRNLVRWQLTHSGPMTTNLAEAGGFARTDPELPAPDIQWHVIAAPYQNYGLDDPSVRALSVLITLLTPGSRGRVRLRSADPRHKAAVDPAYLSDLTDIDRLVTAVGMAREIAGAPPLARMCAEELAPGDEVKSDVDLREWIRGQVTTIYHPVGTCAMGGDSPVAASRQTSVVDTDLRVRGLERLRVVDASVMPTVPRGNTNAPTIAIAERAADLIIGRAPLAPAVPTEPVELLR